MMEMLQEISTKKREKAAMSWASGNANRRMEAKVDNKLKGKCFRKNVTSSSISSLFQAFS